MAQQTAVEWLFEQLWETPKDKLDWYSLLNQAKQMEKEQIIEAFDYDGSPSSGEEWISNGEQYYNDKYKTT